MILTNMFFVKFYLIEMKGNYMNIIKFIRM